MPEQPKPEKPRYEVIWTNPAQKQLRRIDRAAQPRILADTRALADEPRPAGVERKSGPWAGYYSIRVGIHYRAAYLIDDAALTVTIAKVGPRENFWQQPPG